MMESKQADGMCGVSEHSHTQRGAYAVEFGLVFGLLMAVVYILVLGGVYFTTSQVMTWAAEEGARAALRHAPDFQSRLLEANRVAEWRASPFLTSTSHSILGPGSCGATSGEVGVCLRIGVTSEVPVPVIPGLKQVLPETVSGYATIYLPGVAVGANGGS